MADALMALSLLEVMERSLQYSKRDVRLRIRTDAFQLPEKEFVNLFRLSKRMVADICQELRFELQPKHNCRNAIPLEIKILSALRFFATGSYQRGIGEENSIGLSQKSISRCVTSVSNVINAKLLKKWIKFPSSNNFPKLKQKFMEISGFPGVIGAIDCTHVAIIAPSSTDAVYKEFVYVNRKGYHSINVQIVCDASLRIININAKFPGSTHDSHIWKASNLRQAFINENINTNRNAWLLGDSGYPLEPWLLTPIADPLSNSSEEEYNKKHIAARICIERCNGVLKSCFRCLTKHRVLHYTPTTAAKIINTCAILHNMCIKECLNLEEIVEDTNNDQHEDIIHNEPSFHFAGYNIQQQILRTHFGK